MSEERGQLQGEIEKARIEIESLRQTKQQVEAENASLLERLGTLEEHQVRTYRYYHNVILKKWCFECFIFITLKKKDIKVWAILEEKTLC